MLRGKYRLESKLGEGGMGEIWLATHVRLNQKVAIKRLLDVGSPAAVERFLREARTAATLTSDHVVRIIDVDEAEDGAPFFVMEHLEGQDLSELLKQKGPLPPEEACRLVLEACEGLAEAHSRGVIHRDIKPANLFLAERANGTRIVKILDFGISKIEVAEGVGLTTTARIMGSPKYMSPEQMRATRDVDARTDIWSLGIVLYQLLSNRLPFTGAVPVALAAAVMIDAPTPLEGVPPELERIVMRCLEKEPGARFATVVELAQALAPLAGDPLLATSVRKTAEAASSRPSILAHAPTERESRRTQPDSEAKRVTAPTIDAATTGQSVQSVQPAPPQRRWAWIAISAVCILSVATVLVFARRNRAEPATAATTATPPATAASRAAPTESTPASAPASASTPPTTTSAPDAGTKRKPITVPAPSKDPLDVGLK